MITESFYGMDLNEGPCKVVLITVPHGASGEGAFFSRFPEILRHAEVRKQIHLFRSFLKIEQDRGASELAHRLALQLEQLMPGHAILVLETAYPRALLDGGRDLTHCVRPFLPDDLLKILTEPFRSLHQKNLKVIRDRLRTARESGGIVVDMHTMAAYCPEADLASLGSWSRLPEYVAAFTGAVFPGRKRRFDLITGDGGGKELAPEGLVKSLEAGLKPHLEISRNEPYAALDHFLMNELMRECPGVAIDIPKHLIAEGHLEDFDLESFKFSWEKIDWLCHQIACGIRDYLGEDLR